jgi:transposase
VARTGGQWRYLPNDLPPWFVVYQQIQRWLRAGCLEMLVEDVRSLLREWGGRKGQPTAVVIDSRTLRSTPESGARAVYVFWIFPRVDLMLMAFLPIWVAMEGRPI